MPQSSPAIRRPMRQAAQTESTDSHAVLDRARVIMRDNHGIGHATLQVEPDTHEGCDEVAW